MEKMTWSKLLCMYNTEEILQGQVEGIERVDYNGVLQDSCVILYDDYKILIPREELDLLGIDLELPKEKLRSILRNLVGATVEFVISSINNDKNVVFASRKKANQIKRNNAPSMEVGDIILTNVIYVCKNGALVEFSGIQYKLPISEIAWGRIYDVRDYINAGDKINMIVTEKFGDAVKVSLKKLKEEPYKKYIEDVKLYTENGEYEGEIREINEHGIYVQLKLGITALCNFPNWERFNPHINEKVIIMIKRIRFEKRLIDGTIMRQL